MVSNTRNKDDVLVKVFLTGGSSLLGKSLKETAPKRHTIESTWYTNYQPDLHQMNVTDKSQVRYVFDKVQPEIVIHCAANGSVDHAEKNYQEVYQVNVNGTDNILTAAKDYEAKIIYISSNAVFDGESPPYSEDSACNPVNAYGKIKLQAERLVKDSKHWLIIRPFLLYGRHFVGGRRNWATLTVDKLRESNIMTIVNDTYWMPTYAKDCAKAIWKLLEYESEIFHVAGPDTVSLFEFVSKVAVVFWLKSENIKPVGSNFFPNIAPRPRDTTYDLSKINALGIKLSGIEKGLKKMRKNEK